MEQDVRGERERPCPEPSGPPADRPDVPPGPPARATASEAGARAAPGPRQAPQARVAVQAEVPWFDRWPELAAWELAAFRARGLPAAVDEEAKAAGCFVVKSQVRFRDRTVDIEVRYPPEPYTAYYNHPLGPVVLMPGELSSPHGEEGSLRLRLFDKGELPVRGRGRGRHGR